MMASKNNKLNLLSVLCCTTVLLLSGCASTAAIKSGSAKSSEIDPFEDFNRSMFTFNKALDDYVANPVVDAYTWATPNFIQTGIGNFFNNIKDINVVLNDIMQAKFSQAGEDSGRFLLNSTVGLGGLIDVATDSGLVKHDEDFDQTLATWGVPQGPYLVLPVLGPTTSRGIPGTVLDTATNPVSYIGMPVQLLGLLNARANADGSLKMIDEASLDPYIFTREAFFQFRNNLITDGKMDLTDDDLDDAVDAEKAQHTKIPSAKSAATANSKGFAQAIDDLNNAEKSLNHTERYFKEAAAKIEQLQHK
jgi:phospholipid-binding lipoprotein MlaA